MNILKIGGFILSVLMGWNAVLAQSNPGYLGNTYAIEVSTTGYIPGVLAHGPWVKNYTSFAVEKAVSKSVSWRGGLRVGSGEFDLKESEMDENFVRFEDEFGNSQTTNSVAGELGYSMTEFFIAPRWYNNNSGAIAPFGSFYGLELAYANVAIDDRIIWSGRSITLPAVTQGFSTLSLALQWGHRRVLFDNLCWDYHMGFGFNLFNTGDAVVSLYGDNGTDNSNHEAVVHELILRPLAWGRIFHGGVGLSYLF